MKTASQSPARAAKTRRSAQISHHHPRRLGAAFSVLAVIVLAFPLPPASAESALPAGGETAGSAVGHPDTIPAPGASEKPSTPPPEPSGYRMEDFRTPVPLTLQGARVLDGDAAADLWNKNAAVFVDVYPQAPKPANLPAGTFWRDPVHRSMEGARWLPNVGYGALSPEMETYFRTRLEDLSKGKRDAPLVFFCLKDCWMSWNAAKRALEWGYTNVMWFRDGTDAWQELGYPLQKVDKVP